MQLRDFKVLSFDCYGTLIDWETGITAALQPLTDKVTGRLESQLDRDAILAAHARHESFHQRQTPAKRYRDILATVYRRLAEEWQVDVSWGECRDYGRAVKTWPAFADTVQALAYLKQHYKLVILSNIDNKSFRASNARLQVNFDAVYSAEDVGSYKPADANFDYMLAQLAMRDIAKNQILHVAESMFHDHAPANRQGLTSCWIHRRHAAQGFGATMPPGDMPAYQFRFNSLAELVAAHKSELAA